MLLYYYPLYSKVKVAHEGVCGSSATATSSSSIDRCYCIKTYQPVCDIHGMTHLSACTANCRSVNIASFENIISTVSNVSIVSTASTASNVSIASCENTVSTICNVNISSFKNIVNTVSNVNIANFENNVSTVSNVSIATFENTVCPVGITGFFSIVSIVDIVPHC